MKVHLVDGTYELFRFHYAKSNRDPRQGAQRGVLNTVLDLIRDGATHVGIATDHVITSWRNDLYDGYKDGADIDPDLFAQVPEVEELLTLAGFVVWPQIEHEADDAMAAGAALAAADERVEQVILGELADRLEHREARLAVRVVFAPHQALVDQRREPLDDLQTQLAVGVGDRLDRFQGEPAGERAEPPGTTLARARRSARDSSPAPRAESAVVRVGRGLLWWPATSATATAPASTSGTTA